MLKGNKGEWSEIYTLIKILGDKKLYAGDRDLKKIEGLIYPIIKVLRTESNGTFEFYYDDSLVIINDDNKHSFSISVSEFHKQASSLLIQLKRATGSSFSIPDTEEFIRSFNCKTLKAKSSLKSDITIKIHDPITGLTPELGFSIKSQIGGSATLLNASGATNFIYKITGLDITKNDIDQINSISTPSKIMKRIEEVIKRGGAFEFIRTGNPTFGNNLVMIDSALSQIMAHIVLTYYSTKNTTMSDLVAKITNDNPQNFDLSSEHPFYEYKIKRLLTDIALGMMPATKWTGQLDATGGYLIVKEDGEILCYHIYNRNEFEQYLLNNTKLETASSSRHDFGSVYIVEECLYMNLNLQIRFIR